MKIAQVLLSLILSLALLACSHNSGNVNENHKEQHLLLSNHISNEQINGFMEDRFGQMWISTFRGLNKYDGNTFHQYYCTDDSIGLPDNNVKYCYRDSRGQLWVSTVNGLCRYNGNDGFTRVRMNVKNKYVLYMLESRDHRLFFVTMDQVWNTSKEAENMAQNNTPVKALVLAGGGARGSYQVGVWRALTELGWRPQIITGTSVGSLNGAMFALDLYETARDMWLTIRSQDVMELPAEDAPLSELHAFLKDAVTQGGMDVTPLEEIVERVLDEDKLRKSPIRLGLVTVEQKTLKARELPLEDIPEGKVKDYLLASAACFPALRAHTIDGVSYLDGGYRDNMPTALAQKMGAEELVCVDLEGVGITRPNRTGLPTTLIRSYWELGDILHFEPATARRNIELGYHDTLRAFGRLRGCAYAVDSGAESSADAAAFHAAFEAVQKDVREKHPSTLTADAALLLAKLSDAELAPLEAVAEDVGVDPAPYYTTRTLGEAFLAKCDFERLRSFEPLFEGEAGPAQAARAALLPNTFLQALVCRALTGRVPPEEMET